MADVVVEVQHGDEEGEYDLYLTGTGENPAWYSHLCVRVSTDKIDCYVDDVHTSEQHRRQGFAETLMRYLDEWEVTASIDKTLIVYETNTEALAMYDKLGYERIIRMPNYTGMRENVWVMRKAGASQ